MITERIEKGEVIKGYYDSSNVLASEYAKNEKKLTIIFGSGKKYDYKDVSLVDFLVFETADSQGKILNSIIKPKYDYELIGSIDLKEIAKELAKINEDNLILMEDEIKNSMNDILTNGFVDIFPVKNLNALITAYLDKRK